MPLADIERVLNAMMRSPEMRRALQDHPDIKALTRRGAALAPKRTGAGAASIRAQPVLAGGRWVVRVSWDTAHDYLRFPNQGTRHIRAQRFLQRSAASFGGKTL